MFPVLCKLINVYNSLWHAYAIYIESLIIVLFITCQNTWTELQPQCRCEFMEMYENASGNDVHKVVVISISITRLVHTK